MTPEPEQISAPPRIAAVLVTAGDRNALIRALDALSGLSFVIVVANGGDETTGLTYPNVRFIPLPRNFGLTRALNIGIRAAEGAQYVLLLSPEVEIGALECNALADILEAEPATGAVCPLLIDPAGIPVAQTGALPTPADPDPALRPATPGQRTAFASGKAILFRSFLLRALRQIDEKYGDYGSAIELCQQVRRANKTILIHPTVTARMTPTPRVPANAAEADREVGTARYLMKHCGLFSGGKYLVGRVLAALFSFRFGKAFALMQLKKVDGA